MIPRPQRGGRDPVTVSVPSRHRKNCWSPICGSWGIDPGRLLRSLRRPSTSLRHGRAHDEEASNESAFDELKLTDAEELPCADSSRAGAITERPILSWRIWTGPNTPRVAIDGRAIRARLCTPDFRFAPALDDLSAVTGGRMDKVVNTIDGVANVVDRLTLQPKTAYERYRGSIATSADERCRASPSGIVSDNIVLIDTELVRR